MGDSLHRRHRRTARAAAGDGANRPSELRQALADLGRVIGEPAVTDPGQTGTGEPHPEG